MSYPTIWFFRRLHPAASSWAVVMTKTINGCSLLPTREWHPCGSGCHTSITFAWYLKRLFTFGENSVWSLFSRDEQYGIESS